MSPSTLTISLLNVKEKLLEKLRIKYTQQQEQRKKRALDGLISVSDTIHCLRQVCFRHLDENFEYTEQELKFFHHGELKHKEYQTILNIDKEEFACEREYIHKNLIIAHPDAISLDDGAIIEIKTTETDSVLEQPHEGNVRQLKYYLAIVGAPYGKIFYTILGKFKKNGRDIPTFFPEYTIVLKPGEREQILEELEDKAEQLLAGIHFKDPSLTDHIANNPEYFVEVRPGFKINWMCAKCRYKTECNEMREKAGEFQKRVQEAEMMKIPESWRPK